MTGPTSHQPAAGRTDGTRHNRSRPGRPAGADTPPHPVHVPGYGWVSWPRALLDAQARYLTFIHRPDRPPLALRVRRWLRLGGPWRTHGPRDDVARCVFCGQEWICPEAAWAAGWLSPMVRLRGRCRPRHRGRAATLFQEMRRLRRPTGTPGRIRHPEHDPSTGAGGNGHRTAPA